MSHASENDQNNASRPCRRCVVLRLFIMSVLAIGTVGLLIPEKLSIIRHLDTMDFALGAVGILAFLAISRHALEWMTKRNEENDQD